MCRIARTRLLILSLFSAFAPLLLLDAIAIAIALSDLPALLPAPAAFLFASSFLIGSGLLAWNGLIKLNPPTKQTATRSIDALLEGDPATAQTDRPAQFSLPAHVLWFAHAQRMAEQSAHLKAPTLAEYWKQNDPWHLRLFLPLLCLAMLVYAGDSAPKRLYSSLIPDPGTLLDPHSLPIEAWALPPAYTGKPPLTLKNGDTTATAPQNSEITIRVSTTGTPTIYQNKQKLRPEKGADGVHEIKTMLPENLSISVRYRGKRSSFYLSGTKDLPPVVQITTAPEKNQQDQVAFVWDAADDYGITSAKLALSHQNGKKFLVELPLSALEPKTVTETTLLDLTRHPLAGMQVSMQLQVTDATGQTGFSNSLSFQLPEKLFLDPLARAIAETRREILHTQKPYLPHNNPPPQTIAPELASRIEYAPKSIQRAGIMLDALTYKPHGHINDTLVFLALRYARSALNAAHDLNEAQQTETLLWHTALRAEYGNLADARRNLNAAAKALERALRDGASDEKIQRLIAAMRQAVQNFLQALLLHAQTSGTNAMPAPNYLQSQDLENMLEALEELAETGARNQARQVLSSLSRILDNLQNAQIRPGNGTGMPGPMSSGANDKNIEALADLLRDQRELNDQTFSRSQPGSQNKMQNSQNPLANKQKELANRLQNLLQQPDSSQVKPLLEQALKSQEQAEQALRKGDDETAMAAQRDTSSQLREAITKLAQDNDNKNSPAVSRDPLNRPGNADNGNETEIPGQMERQRARKFLDELRRRSEEPSLPALEMEYLERLLRRF